MILYEYRLALPLIVQMFGSCHLDRASNDEFSIKLFVLIFSADLKIRSESSTNLS